MDVETEPIHFTLDDHHSIQERPTHDAPTGSRTLAATGETILATNELLAGENELSSSQSIHANSRATKTGSPQPNLLSSYSTFKPLTNLVESCLASDGIVVAISENHLVKPWISSESAKASSLCNSASSSVGMLAERKSEVG